MRLISRSITADPCEEAKIKKIFTENVAWGNVD